MGACVCILCVSVSLCMCVRARARGGGVRACVRVCVRMCGVNKSTFSRSLAMTVCHRKQINSEKCIFVAANSLQLRER